MSKSKKLQNAVLFAVAIPVSGGARAAQNAASSVNASVVHIENQGVNMHYLPVDNACELSTKQECRLRTECYYNEQDDACQASWVGSAELLFNHFLPGCNFYFYVSFIALLTSVYLLVVSIFKHKSMPRFLRNDPSLMAYTLVSGAVITVLAYIGVVAVYNHWGQEGWDTAFKRLTIRTPEGDMVAQIHASYQLWNLAMVCLRWEGWVSFVHHLFCTYLGTLNSEGFGCYHLIYMGGVAELSTIILTAMDVFKNNKYLQEDYPVANMFTRYLFCAVFIILRVFVWFTVLASFFSDIYTYLSEDGNQKFRLHCYMNVLAMVILSLIQLLWARLVVLGILKALGIISRPSKSSRVAAQSDNSGSSRRSSVSTECSNTVAKLQNKKQPETKKRK